MATTSTAEKSHHLQRQGLPPTAAGTTITTTARPQPKGFNSAMSSSSLLALPPELRLRIYEFVIASDRELYMTLEGELSKPEIVGTCKQIHDEFLPIFDKHALILARAVMATVDDFDFTALIKTVQAAAPVRQAGDGLKVDVDLEFTDDIFAGMEGRNEDLAEWFECFTAPTTVSYTLDDDLSAGELEKLRVIIDASWCPCEETECGCAARVNKKDLSNEVFGRFLDFLGP